MTKPHDDEQDFDLSAAGLRADGAALEQDIEVLAGKLEGALPDACHVERRRRRLFSSRRRVAAIDVTLGDSCFSLRACPAITAERTERVHDMRTRTDRMQLDEWLTALQDELALQAETSAEAREALDRLFGA